MNDNSYVLYMYKFLASSYSIAYNVHFLYSYVYVYNYENYIYNENVIAM